MAESNLEKLFDDLIVAATGTPRPNSFDALWADQKAVAVPEAATVRCSMCNTPSEAKHETTRDCMISMQKRLAKLTGDKGYLPAAFVPPRTYDEWLVEAYKGWLSKPAAWKRERPWGALNLPVPKI